MGFSQASTPYRDIRAVVKGSMFTHCSSRAVERYNFYYDYDAAHAMSSCFVERNDRYEYAFCVTMADPTSIRQVAGYSATFVDPL